MRAANIGYIGTTSMVAQKRESVGPALRVYCVAAGRDPLWDQRRDSAFLKQTKLAHSNWALRRKSTVFRRYAFVRQNDGRDCGAAALATVEPVERRTVVPGIWPLDIAGRKRDARGASKFWLWLVLLAMALAGVLWYILR
jgi:hypothetical protein